MKVKLTLVSLIKYDVGLSEKKKVSLGFLGGGWSLQTVNS